MKSLAASAFIFLAAFSAQAQDDGAERARIEAERTVVNDRFAEQKRACSSRFAVTDCVEKATRERNAALSDLRRQERVLDDAERKRRAAERLKEQDERHSPERLREAEERRARALADQKEREERAAEKAAKRAAGQAQKASEPPRVRTPSEPAGPQGAARAPQKPKNPPLSAEEAAKNRAAHEARLQEAQAHKAEVRERVAKRAKPAASALPVPK
jgi:colicin import membrane protein